MLVAERSCQFVIHFTNQFLFNFFLTVFLFNFQFQMQSKNTICLQQEAFQSFIKQRKLFFVLKFDTHNIFSPTKSTSNILTFLRIFPKPFFLPHNFVSNSLNKNNKTFLPQFFDSFNFLFYKTWQFCKLTITNTFNFSISFEHSFQSLCHFLSVLGHVIKFTIN